MAHRQEGKKEGKLVRDLIPAIIAASGAVPKTRVLSSKAYKAALRTKLVEEAQECVAAQGRTALIEELADAREVIDAICHAEKIKASDVTSAARKKRKMRGGFTKQLFLISIRKK